MGQEDTLNVGHRDSLGFQCVFNDCALHSGINQEAAAVIAYVGTIAGASGAEAHEAERLHPSAQGLLFRGLLGTNQRRFA